jgi:hypothetical protein
MKHLRLKAEPHDFAAREHREDGGAYMRKHMLGGIYH